MTIARFVSAGALTLAACSVRNGVMPLGSNPNTVAITGQSSHSYRTIYSFGQGGKTNDGSRPVSTLRITGSLFYGTTPSGGTATMACSLGCGTVFTVAPAHSERVIYRFKGGADGSTPTGAVVAIGNALFGTTGKGGSATSCSSGCGTLFRMSLSGTHERVLYRFKGGRDGNDPFSGVIAMGSALYGATLYGGAQSPACLQGCGTIFSATAKGTGYRVLYRFKGGTDGAAPLAPLIAAGGLLYGVTMYGGNATTPCATGCGTVFRLDPNGTERVLYRFHNTRLTPDAAYPAGSLLWNKGMLYGTTLAGGTAGVGSIFSLSPSDGKERVLHSFGVQKGDGNHPVAGVISVNGALYGVTRDGGNGKGVIFKTTIDGAESVLYRFAGRPDGATPEAHLGNSNGKLYGTTTWGGQTSQGTIFELAP